MGEQRRVAVRVRGRVQGVFYRASARTTGTRLRLSGWVRNCDDGSVEAVAEGPQEDIEEFIAWCRIGPPAARVERVEVTVDGDGRGLPSGFEVRF